MAGEPDERRFFDEDFVAREIERLRLRLGVDFPLREFADDVEQIRQTASCDLARLRFRPSSPRPVAALSFILREVGGELKLAALQRFAETARAALGPAGGEVRDLRRRYPCSGPWRRAGVTLGVIGAASLSALIAGIVIACEAMLKVEVVRFVVVSAASWDGAVGTAETFGVCWVNCG